MRKVRIYQRDKADQIRIGPGYLVEDVFNEVDRIKAGYSERFGCSFEEGCSKYGYTIAIVDADTLEMMVMIS